MNLGNSWDDILAEEYSAPYFQHIIEWVSARYNETTVFPPKGSAFRALYLTPFDQTKVVIIGQDPYHRFGQAMGLSFSVPIGVDIPPSLVNIYKEMLNDLEGVDYPTALRQIGKMNGDLTYLAKQGVLLLNSALTVEEGKPAIHKELWAPFTDNVIKRLSRETSGIVFILWGAHAISKRSFVDETKHLVLTSVHPSPLSAYGGFFGSKPFSKTNEYLLSNGKTPIDWLNRSEKN